MPIHEPSNLTAIALHVKHLTTLTQDQTAIDTLMHCAAELARQAQSLAEDELHRQIAAHTDPDDPQVS